MCMYLKLDDDVDYRWKELDWWIRISRRCIEWYIEKWRLCIEICLIQFDGLFFCRGKMVSVSYYWILIIRQQGCTFSRCKKTSLKTYWFGWREHTYIVYTTSRLAWLNGERIVSYLPSKISIGQVRLQNKDMCGVPHPLEGLLYHRETTQNSTLSSEGHSMALLYGGIIHPELMNDPELMVRYNIIRCKVCSKI